MTGHQPTIGTVRHSTGSDRAREEACLTGGMYSAEYVFTGVVDTVVCVFQPESEVFAVDVCL